MTFPDHIRNFSVTVPNHIQKLFCDIFYIQQQYRCTKTGNNQTSMKKNATIITQLLKNTTIYKIFLYHQQNS